MLGHIHPRNDSGSIGSSNTTFRHHHHRRQRACILGGTRKGESWATTSLLSDGGFGMTLGEPGAGRGKGVRERQREKRPTFEAILTVELIYREGGEAMVIEAITTTAGRGSSTIFFCRKGRESGPSRSGVSRESRMRLRGRPQQRRVQRD